MVAERHFAPETLEDVCRLLERFRVTECGTVSCCDCIARNRHKCTCDYDCQPMKFGNDKTGTLDIIRSPAALMAELSGSTVVENITGFYCTY